MEQASYARTPAAKSETATQKATMRVCLHALRPARTDVRVMRTATALTQAGFAVSIVDIEHDHERSRKEDFGGVRMKHILMPSRFIQYYDPVHFMPWLLFKAARILLGVFEILKTPADIYHAHDITALPACYIAARLHQKVLIYDAYELPLVDPDITRWRLLHAISVRLLRAMMPRCSGIITVSPPLVRELQRGYGGKTAVLVRNIPIYQAPHSSDRLRRFLGLSSETRIALYQGNLQANRTLDVVIRAAKFMVPGIVIVMMGKAIQPDLEALIIHEGVSDRVKIIPAVPYAELLEWTASADIGLIVYNPSRSPNVKMMLPNKLFEYLMAGVPVLASSLEAVTDVLKTYDVGRIVPSLAPEEVGCAISAMLADREGLARMRRNALTASQRELRWDIESQRLIRLYQDILSIHDDGAAEVQPSSN